jgi:putative FmdB family regulatory protein
MPIFEYLCDNCGEINEVLVLGKEEPSSCQGCGNPKLTKLMSAHNTVGTSLSPAADCSGCGSQNGCGSPGTCGSPGSCCSN